MALFEHVLVYKQELSTADLETELQNHTDTCLLYTSDAADE